MNGRRPSQFSQVSTLKIVHYHTPPTFQNKVQRSVGLSKSQAPRTCCPLIFDEDEQEKRQALIVWFFIIKDKERAQAAAS